MPDENSPERAKVERPFAGESYLVGRAMKTLTFDDLWRVAMLPHRMIEYLVTHELVHLVKRSHSDAFWERLERIIPDYADRQRWLKEHVGIYNL
jgi:predicted metal-dependent hydrolase